MKMVGVVIVLVVLDAHVETGSCGGMDGSVVVELVCPERMVECGWVSCVWDWISFVKLRECRVRLILLLSGRECGIGHGRLSSCDLTVPCFAAMIGDS
jgi:hypothetical protein